MEKLIEEKQKLKRNHQEQIKINNNSNNSNKKQKTSIYYNHKPLILTPNQNHISTSNSTDCIQHIKSSSNPDSILPQSSTTYFTQPSRTNYSNHSTQYSKKPSMFGVHDKTNAVKRKLERLKLIASTYHHRPILLTSSSTLHSTSPLLHLHPIMDTLIEQLAKEIPVKEFRNRIKHINEADNQNRLHRAFQRNQKIPSFYDTIIRNSDATLDTPRPPEPCLPTYQQIRHRQRLLDLTFGKGKIRKRHWRKSLELDKITLVEKTLSRKTGLISELPAGGYIQAHDIQKLRPRQWINDEIVTFYTVLINQRSVEFETSSSNSKDKSLDYDQDEKFLKVHCFNSFFMPKYDKDGYNGVKRWSKKVDLLSKDVIIFPINIGNAHWTCGAINLRAKRFEYFDSMGHQNPSVLANLRDYIANEALAKKNITLDLADWPDFYYKDLPQQNNSFDCGIFVIQFMDCLSRDWSFNSTFENNNDEFNTSFDFDQSNMDYIRTKMVYEIVTKKFLKEEWN